MKEKLANIIRNNDENSLNVFIDRYMNGDTEKFLEFISKMGLIEDGEIFDTLIEMFPMTYLHMKYRSNPDATTKYIVDNYFGDLKATEDGRYFLTLNDRESLSIFFKNDGGRNDMGSKEFAKLIFQDDWWEPYDDVYMDSIYDEVIENLTPENLRLLADKINDELSGSEVSPETSLLEDIAEDQGHPEYVDLSTELILETIFEDKESTEFLLEEASDVSSELYSLYSNSYSTAYTDEKWENATNEIKSLLSTDNIGEWKSRKVTNYNGEEKTISDYYIDVTNFVPYVIQSVFDDEYMNDDYRNAFEYYGDFEGLVNETINEDVIEGASISIPYYDYPDSDRVVKYVNELFRDYI